MKTLVLGMGNTILCDDGIGIYVVREVVERFRGQDVDFAEASVGGMRILDVIGGYDRVVMVDAIQTGDGDPGDIHRLTPQDLRLSLHAGSSHDLSLPGALALGRGMGLRLPDDKDFLIVAIEVEDVLSFGEECTPAVQRAIPLAVDMVLAELEEQRGDTGP
ncbi:MAG: hydrogenase maturation protease [Chloroflexota bacterium]|nr:hydrogenase maturation protease [Chloroflexota bacterium]